LELVKPRFTGRTYLCTDFYKQYPRPSDNCVAEACWIHSMRTDKVTQRYKWRLGNS
jgi:hypothetical protein